MNAKSANVAMDVISCQRLRFANMHKVSVRMMCIVLALLQRALSIARLRCFAHFHFEMKSDSIVCRPKASSCDVEERCTGYSPECPLDVTQVVACLFIVSRMKDQSASMEMVAFVAVVLVSTFVALNKACARSLCVL